MKPMSTILPDSVKRLKVFVQELVQIDQQQGRYVVGRILCVTCDATIMMSL